MIASTVPPEIEFLQDPVRGWGAVLVASTALLMTVCWSKHGEALDRRAVLWASLATAVLMDTLNLTAWATGWWGRPGLTMPFSMVGVLASLVQPLAAASARP